MAGSTSRGGIRGSKFVCDPEYIAIVQENTPQRFVDGAGGTHEPKPRSGNPFFDPLTGKRYDGAPS